MSTTNQEESTSLDTTVNDTSIIPSSVPPSSKSISPIRNPYAKEAPVNKPQINDFFSPSSMKKTSPSSSLLMETTVKAPSPTSFTDDPTSTSPTMFSTNTIATKKQAINIFNKFVDNYNNKPPYAQTEGFKTLPIPKFENLSAEFLPQSIDVEKLAKTFCTYLLKEASPTNNAKKHYSSGTILNFLSNWFTELKSNKTLEHLCFYQMKEDWYSEIYHKLQLRANADAMYRGDHVTKRQLSTRRALLEQIVMYTIKTNRNSLNGYLNRYVTRI